MISATSRGQTKHDTSSATSGNIINHKGDVRTLTTEMLLFKIMLNSVVFTSGVRFMYLDISDQKIEIRQAEVE